jgi:hypothetical protein
MSVTEGHPPSPYRLNLLPVISTEIVVGRSGVFILESYGTNSSTSHNRRSLRTTNGGIHANVDRGWPVEPISEQPSETVGLVTLNSNSDVSERGPFEDAAGVADSCAAWRDCREKHLITVQLGEPGFGGADPLGQ